MVGALDGWLEGLELGSADGPGDTVGAEDETPLGPSDGAIDGMLLGFCDGWVLGTLLGTDDFFGGSETTLLGLYAHCWASVTAGRLGHCLVPVFLWAGQKPHC